MNGYIDAVLNDCNPYGFAGGPRFNTQITPGDNGSDWRNGNWVYPKHQHSTQLKGLTPEEQYELLTMIMVARGMLRPFKFKDWNDYQLVDEEIGIAASGSAPLQVTKTYTRGGESTTRIIYAVDPTAVVSVDGTPIAGTFDLFGKFTPTLPWPASGLITISGIFYLWVQWAADYNPITINNWRQHQAAIEVVEHWPL